MTMFSDDEFSRVTHSTDAVVHIPSPLMGYKHAGKEIWYNNETDPYYYIECKNGAGAPENITCSESIWLAAGIEEHRHYLGLPISNMCLEYEPPLLMSKLQSYY
jgi:hypothetical protein